MIHIRRSYTVHGGHTWVKVFAGPAPDQTLSKAGDLVFANEEWEQIMAGQATVEYVPGDRRVSKP